MSGKKKRECEGANGGGSSTSAAQDRTAQQRELRKASAAVKIASSCKLFMLTRHSLQSIYGFTLRSGISSFKTHRVLLGVSLVKIQQLL